jgi:hypothetical protein
MTKTIRNVLIVLAIAAAVVIVPGGGTAANVLGHAVVLAFLAALVWFAAVMYRQHHAELYSLGDRRRAILYAAIGVATLTLTATSRLTQTGGGSVVWLLLLGASAYAMFTVIWTARKY